MMEEKKYHLANWQMIAQKKEHGGLGIHDFAALEYVLTSLLDSQVS